MSITKIKHHQAELKQCHKCPDMTGPPVVGKAIRSKVMLIGQAPGDKEILIPKPFAWTAGKTLFKWFTPLGMDEETFRQHVYMAAVCRCFPGKKPRGGDRVPNLTEIKNCAVWLQREYHLLQPELVIAVGKLAISQFIEVKKLIDVIGRKHVITLDEQETDLIPLPHPSGASTWHITEPGKTLLKQALKLIHQHPAWQHCLKKS